MNSKYHVIATNVSRRTPVGYETVMEEINDCLKFLAMNDLMDCEDMFLNERLIESLVMQKVIRGIF